MVLPAYNAERSIGRTLASIFAQTRLPLEVVVVDDGSTDGTAAVVRAATAGAPVPVRLIRQPNGGAASARNLAVGEAHGDWIAFIDADDEFAPIALDRLSDLIARAPDAALVFGDAQRREAGRLKDASYIRHRLRTPGIDYIAGDPNRIEAPAEHVILGAFTAHGAFAARRDALLKAGPCNPEMRHAIDRDMLLRLAQAHAGPWVFSWDVLATITYNEGSLSSRSNLWKHGLAQLRAVDDYVARGGALDARMAALVEKARRRSLAQAFYWAAPSGPSRVLAVARALPPSVSFPARPLTAARPFLMALARSLRPRPRRRAMGVPTSVVVSQKQTGR